MADEERPTADVEQYRSPNRGGLGRRTGEHRWRVRSSNGRVLTIASEGYHNREDMLAAMRLTRDALARADLGDTF
jgi:uncharacterized protein YegP (UPF0339 family)